MSDNEEENPGDKRRPDFIEPSNQPQKRQRVVNLDSFVPNNRDLIGQLTQLGQNLSLVSDASRVPETEISDNFVAIQQQINNALQEAFEQAQLVRRQNEEQRMASEMAQMGQQERDQFQLLRDDFLRRLQPLAQRMSEQLTYGEQAQMFNIILNSIDTRLNENDFNNSQGNPAVLLMELASITYNFALEQLAVSISNIYQATPNLVRQLTSLIAASGMVYNYLPNEARGGFTVIPYFGPLFSLMNRINPQLRRIQNSAAAVTTIYYLLRNAGIDTTDSIQALGASARELATTCTLEAGRYICSGLGLASQAATSIIDGIANQLGNILTREYQDFSFSVESQESQESSSSSLRSISSQRTVDTLKTQDSSRSIATAQTINQLLNTPVEDGGSSLYLEAIDGPIVEQRLVALGQENAIENPEPIIEGLVTEENLQIITQPPSISLQPDSYRSQETGVSEITNLSEDTDEHWSFWLFGPNNSGGKRLRKSRRRMGKRKRKTRKPVKKGKKGTKKGRKSKKTLKRRK
jgi:hypothetical protein